MSGESAQTTAAMETAGSSTLLAALELTPCEPEHFDLAWSATTQYCPWPKAYGGDMVAQAAAAAMLSVDADRRLHSMHSYFMRPVDIGAEVRYEVELLRDGRGYSTRQVRAYQGGKPVYTALASFQVPEDGAELTPALPAGIPAPETLPTSAEYLADIEPGTPEAGTLTPAAKEYWSSGRSFDMRHVRGPVYVRVEGERTTTQAVWVRAFEDLGAVPAGALGGAGSTVAALDLEQVHTAALAYVCDYTIIEPTLRALGHAWADPGLVTASLDHAMWFHRPARADEWLLYVQEAAGAQSGRGLGLGRFFDSDGRLVATVAQEAMIRPGRGHSSR
ncbi:acyl-CoA thioesterase domain-containing protein [Sinomonas sp. ASV322]|uniref:acyl-CoA thioesterase n=1 Tax=Sinomonas sp. ASV322 TaxID=3041920 RepID=UPI0027DE8E03|nr:acyl-CoA thioesterase domain-containing protein [Sinomonas sp. ASV322]MDQ4503205.1 thioesterase family protein [Sinomonas sp. ASV322]